MHATAIELELFVTARLPAERADVLARHCDGCSDCAQALADEARLELSLQSMSGERRCGMRADEVARVELPARPVPSTRLYALAAAAAVVLAFVAARLPTLVVPHSAPAVYVDAGDLVRAQHLVPAWADSELSGGTR